MVGYRFEDTFVYCPWDVVSYVNKLWVKRTLPPQDYWTNTSSNDMIKKLLYKAMFRTRDEVERLIAGESVMKPVNEELTYKELIPNREIHNIFMAQIRNWMQGKARENGARLDLFCEALKNAALIFGAPGGRTLLTWAGSQSELAHVSSRRFLSFQFLPLLIPAQQAGI